MGQAKSKRMGYFQERVDPEHPECYRSILCVYEAVVEHQCGQCDLPIPAGQRFVRERPYGRGPRFAHGGSGIRPVCAKCRPMETHNSDVVQYR